MVRQKVPKSYFQSQFSMSKVNVCFFVFILEIPLCTPSRVIEISQNLCSVTSVFFHQISSFSISSVSLIPKHPHSKPRKKLSGNIIPRLLHKIYAPCYSISRNPVWYQACHLTYQLKIKGQEKSEDFFWSPNPPKTQHFPPNFCL